MKTLRVMFVAMMVFGLAFSGLYGCSKKATTGSEGMESTQPSSDMSGGDSGKTAGEGDRKTVEAPPTANENAEPVEPARDEKALKDVYFDFDSFAINASETASLEGNAAWIKKNSGSVVTIEGHCDERGTVEYNLALGEKRAKAAKDYLESLGVESSRMKMISYGKSKPADNGHDEAAWAKNRRAHFVVQ